MKQSSIFSFVAKGCLKPETPVVDLFCGVRVVHTTKRNPMSYSAITVGPMHMCTPLQSTTSLCVHLCNPLTDWWV